MFKYAPMFGIIVSFKDYNLFKGVWASDWVGFKHYKMFLQNPDAWEIFRNTLILGVYKIIFLYPSPIMLAILFYEMRWKKYRRFVQTVSYMPYLHIQCCHFQYYDYDIVTEYRLDQSSDYIVTWYLNLSIFAESGMVSYHLYWFGYLAKIGFSTIIYLAVGRD